MNGAGGRAEIAGSEQSVRVLGNAPGRLSALADADRAARRPLRQARRPRRGQGQQSRAALDRQAERPPGRHLHDPARQGLVRSHRLRRACGRSCKKLEKENPKVHFSEVFTTVDYTKAQYSLGDGRPDRGRGPRGPRRPPVPARHPRDCDFRGRDPALGDPRLLVHEPDGDHAELHVDDGDGPRRRRARRRRDRRDREHRPAHAHGQVGLSGRARRRRRDRPRRARDHDGDRRRLLPGRADARNRRAIFQGVRLHGRPLGADELVRRPNDHAADRGLFPALARRAAARDVEVDGYLPEGPQLEPRHDQGPRAAGPASEGPAPLRLLRDRRFPRAARSSPRSLPAPAATMAVLGKLSWVPERSVSRSRCWSARRSPMAWQSCIGFLVQRVGSGEFAEWHGDRRRALERTPAGSPPRDGRRRLCDAAAQHRPVRHAVDVASSRRRTATIRGSTSRCRREAR